MTSNSIETGDWARAETFYRDRKLYLLDDDMSFIEVVKVLGEDNRTQLHTWIKNGLIYPPTEREVLAFRSSEELQFKFFQALPYLFVQKVTTP